MKNFKIDIRRRGVEILIATVSAETDDGKVVQKDVDLGGNATTAMYAGASRAIHILNELSLVLDYEKADHKSK
jgi:hypothetical protein